MPAITSVLPQMTDAQAKRIATLVMSLCSYRDLSRVSFDDEWLAALEKRTGAKIHGIMKYRSQFV